MEKIPTASSPTDKGFIKKSEFKKQAQIVAFATENIPSYKDKEHIIDNRQNIIPDQDGNVSVSERKRRRVVDEDGITQEIYTTQEDRAITSYDEFLSFLKKNKSKNPDTLDTITPRIELLESYAYFQPTIAQLRSEISELKDPKVHPKYLGAGLSSYVFQVDIDNEKFAARIPTTKHIRATATDAHIAAAIRARGIPHLEQIIAASYDDGVTVAQMMPGKEVDKLSPQEVEGIPDSHVYEFIDTIMAASESEVLIDTKPTNFFYDQKRGFGIVDLGVKSAKVTKEISIGKILGSIAQTLCAPGLYAQKLISEKSHSDYNQDSKQLQVNLALIRKYKSHVESILEDREKDEAIEIMDEEVENIERLIKNHNDPKWIMDQIASEVARKKSQLEESANHLKSPDGKIYIEVDEI